MVYYNSMDDYLKSISYLPLLTREEEHELAIKSKTSKEALHTFIEHNLRLVVFIAKRYFKGHSVDDLIQAGNMGLMKAAERFDPYKNVRFSTYAYFWIKQAIFRELKGNRLIKVPENKVDELSKLTKCTESLRQILGREPLPEEIAAEMNMSVESVVRLRRKGQPMVSLDNIRGDDDEVIEWLASDINIEEDTDRVFDEDLAQKFIKRIPGREQYVIKQRFFEHKTLEEIGKEMGISRERVRQIEKVALERMRS